MSKGCPMGQDPRLYTREKLRRALPSMCLCFITKDAMHLSPVPVSASCLLFPSPLPISCSHLWFPSSVPVSDSCLLFLFLVPISCSCILFLSLVLISCSCPCFLPPAPISTSYLHFPSPAPIYGSCLWFISLISVSSSHLLFPSLIPVSLALSPQQTGPSICELKQICLFSRCFCRGLCHSKENSNEPNSVCTENIFRKSWI